MPGTRKQYRTPVDEKAIGQRLKDLRLRRGMTQVEVARELGINQSAVSEYEKGQIRMHAALIAGFASVLQSSADEILGIEELKQSSHIKDRRFVRRLEKVDKLSKRDRQSLLGTIDAFLSKVS